MMSETTTVYITDKNGGKHFKTLCGADHAMSEVRNLNLKLDQARQYPEAYPFLDIETMKVKTEGRVGDYLPQALGFTDMTDDELLSALGLDDELLSE